jgi:3-methyladenine DNA glycosylase AlkD
MVEEIEKELRLLASPERAVAMAAYMRDRFAFLGIASPVATKAVRGVLSRHGGKKQRLDLAIARALFALPEREFQYAAITYLGYLSAQLTLDHFDFLGELVTTKSWWDSVDSLRGVTGALVRKFPTEGREAMNAWLRSDNFWMRRVAINHLLAWKKDTDTEWLAMAVLHCAHEKEFFIAKAIGWSLREYAYTDPDWVLSFVTKNQSVLQPLSVREALKHF